MCQASYQSKCLIARTTQIYSKVEFTGHVKHNTLLPNQTELNQLYSAKLSPFIIRSEKVVVKEGETKRRLVSSLDVNNVFLVALQKLGDFLIPYTVYVGLLIPLGVFILLAVQKVSLIISVNDCWNPTTRQSVTISSTSIHPITFLPSQSVLHRRSFYIKTSNGPSFI